MFLQEGPVQFFFLVWVEGMIPLVKFLLHAQGSSFAMIILFDYFLSFHAKIIFSTDSKIHWNRAWAYKSIK
jgi:hypothetical protein